MTKEEAALEAERLSKDQFLIETLDGMRMDALEALAAINPDDADAIRAQQATIRVIDQLFGNLAAYMRDGKPKKPAGIV